jgi:hypothetical protein
MSNRKRLPQPDRWASAHRQGRGRHRQPTRTVGELVAIPGQAGAKFLAVGALGSVAMMALPAVASAAATSGSSAATAASPAISLTADALPAPAAAVPAPAVPLSLPPAPSPAASPSAAPSLPGPSAVTSQPPPPTAPAQDAFGAGAQPVPLFNNLTPIGPTFLQTVVASIASKTLNVGVSFFDGVGGSVQLALSLGGSAVTLGAGVGGGGSATFNVTGTPPPTEPSVRFVGTATTEFFGIGAQAVADINPANLPDSSVTVSGPGVTATTPLFAPSTVTVGATRDLGTFGLELSGQTVVTFPLTLKDFLAANALMGSMEVGPTPDLFFPPAASPENPSPTPQAGTSSDATQLQAQPPIPFLFINTSAGPVNTTDGSIGTPGETINPVTGVPGSISGTTGSALLPDQFTFPPAPAPAPDTGPQPFFDPFTGLQLTGLDPAPETAGTAQTTTGAPPAAAGPAQPTAAQGPAPVVTGNPTPPTANTGQPPGPVVTASNPTPPTANTSQPQSPPQPAPVVTSNPTPPTANTSQPPATQPPTSVSNPTPPTADTSQPPPAPIVVVSNPAGGGTTTA